MEIGDTVAWNEQTLTVIGAARRGADTWELLVENENGSRSITWWSGGECEGWDEVPCMCDECLGEE